VFAKKFLASEVELCVPDGQRHTMCSAMKDGNEFYDEQGLQGYLSVFQVANRVQGIGVRVVKDVAVNPAKLEEVVKVLHTAIEDCPSAFSAGVLTIEPYSFALGLEFDRFVLFDSHAHPPSGALLAVLPFDPGSAVQYLRYFIHKYYANVKFDATKWGQFSLLQLQ